MNIPLRTLDVRPTLRAGGEPFDEIMKAVVSLAEGEGLRLLATFEPVPLFKVMELKGYTSLSRPLDGGEWEVTFTPTGNVTPAATVAAGPIAGDGVWPEPVQILDNRGLPPPEPLVLTLEAVERMETGTVLEIWTDRDPLHLYPELARRGHEARPEARGAEGYRVLIRCGTAEGRVP